MKKTTLILFAAIGLIFFNSCKKDPLGCASADKSSVLTGESITFTSCSENSERISWDFGDGNAEEGNSVSHSYSTAGTYLVKMTAYSKKDKDWDKTSMLVTVTDPPVPAKRYLTKIILKSFAAKNSGGNDWDSGAELLVSGPEPDVNVEFGLTSGEWSVTTSNISDATTADVPKTWEYSPQNIYLSSVSWDIIINESDALGSEEMAKWTINPATQSATNNIISLSNSSCAVDIYFEER